MKLLLNTIKILLGSLAAVVISIAMTMGVSMCSLPTVNVGSGMIVSFGGTVKGISIAIKDARLPDGKEFPNAGSFGHSNSPLSGGRRWALHRMAGSCWIGWTSNGKKRPIHGINGYRNRMMNGERRSLLHTAPFL